MTTYTELIKSLEELKNRNAILGKQLRDFRFTHLPLLEGSHGFFSFFRRRQERPKEDFDEDLNILGELIKEYDQGILEIDRITQLISFHELLVEHNKIDWYYFPIEK